jgi:hypothetical protein
MPLRDSIAALLGLAVGGGFFVLSLSVGAGGVFPRAVAGIMMAASLGLLIKAFIKPSAIAPLAREAILRVAAAVVLTLLYIVGVAKLGFITASLVFIPAAAYALGLKRHLLVWVTTVVFVASVYVLFETLFGTPLPRDLILTLF